MTRLLTTALVLLLLGSTMVEARSLAELMVGELHGPKIDQSFRDGVLSGVMLTLGASGGMQCPPMSVNMLKPALAAALKSREITEIWTVYHAVVYVLVKAGCTATETETSKAPMEKPNA